MKKKTWLYVSLFGASLFFLSIVVVLILDGSYMSALFILFFFAIFGSTAGYMIFYEIKKEKFKKFGKKQMARFVDIVKGNVVTRTVNDKVVNVQQYYCVKFQFKGSHGELLEGKTSKNVELSDAEKLKRAYYFEVYVMNNQAMVLNYPSEQEIAKFSNLKNYKYCSYCGSKVSVSEKKCSSCGASDFKDVL